MRSSMLLTASRARKTVVALEAPTETVVPVGDYVNGGILWHDDLLRKVASWPWRTTETRDFLTSLREINANGEGSVCVVGIDPQLPPSRSSPPRPGSQLAERDRIMANRVLSWVDDDTLVVVLAHNAHLSKTSYSVGVPAMGQYLSEALGERYCATAVFTASGSFRARRRIAGITSSRDATIRVPAHPPGSVEAAMHQVTPTGPGRASIFLVDETWASLRWVKQAGYAVNPLTWPFSSDSLEMPKSFDAAVLIGRASPTHAIPF